MSFLVCRNAKYALNRKLITSLKIARSGVSTLAPESEAKKSKSLPIYLDWQATSMLDPRALDAMLPYMTYQFGNPHSRTHKYGWDSEEALEKARSQIAHLVGASPKEVIFTSGATECNNLAVKGCANFYKEKKNHVITTQIEHKCVLDSCRYLERHGCNVTYLKVNKDGLIDLNELEKSITPKTVLVSVMGVNNEIGIMQPLKEIGKICHKHGVFFHSDCAQMIGKEPVNVNDLGVDLMSMSGHKIYGPKGIGALYVRRQPRVRLEPIINGGGQERGLRSGTMPTHLAVGFGKACEIAEESMEFDHERIKKLSDKLINTLQKNLTHIQINGDRNHCYPGCVNISFAGVEGESLILKSKNVAVSSGSACTSASLEPSYVLRALGVSDDLAHTSLRIGIGRFTTEKEIDYACKRIIDSVNGLREISPLWDIIQEGGDLSKMKWK